MAPGYGRFDDDDALIYLFFGFRGLRYEGGLKCPAIAILRNGMSLVKNISEIRIRKSQKLFQAHSQQHKQVTNNLFFSKIIHFLFQLHR